MIIQVHRDRRLSDIYRVNDMPSNPSLWQVIKSVAASAIGVQSSKNYEQDFATSNPLPFIIVGVIFVICFIAALVVWVNYMLA